MEACKFIDFMKVFEPWLNEDYIRKAGLDNNGNFRLQLMDGGIKKYRIDDCSEAQLKDVIEMLQKHGLPVENL